MTETRHDPGQILGTLIKPTSGDCNQRCNYCFYLRSAELYSDEKKHRMPDDVLTELVRQNQELNYPVASFAWQGGEPLLMGLEFFEKAITLMKQYGRPGHSVSNALQTNGIAIDDGYAEFFNKYHFLLGVSLDGPAELHNKFRANSFNKVMNGIETLKKHNVEFNILCVINSLNAEKPEEVYDFFVSSGFQHLQFIPCMEETGALHEKAPYTVSPEKYGEFLCRLFDRWNKDGYPDIHVRFFDNVLEHCLGLDPGSCQMKEKCGSYVVIEYNGDVYPCDFFVYPEWKLGNIMETPLREIAKSQKLRDFARSKSNLRKKCTKCKWRNVCHGGCLRTRYFRREDFEDLDYFCVAYRRLLDHSMDRLQEISVDIASKNPSA